MSKVRIDHETGIIHGLPAGPQPLVGPTTGRAYEELKQKERLHSLRNAFLERQMLSTFQCTQCKRKQSGKNVRVKLDHGAEVLVCSNSKCDAPVVCVMDAGPLIGALKGRLV